MEQTRNRDDAMRKNTRLNTEKKEVQKQLLRKKKERKFCIWFDMKESTRKRRKNEEKRNEIKNKRGKKNEIIQKKRYTKTAMEKRHGNMRLKKKRKKEKREKRKRRENKYR